MVLCALAMGVIADFGAVVFRAMIGGFHNLLFLGLWSFDYDANVQTPPSPWGAWIILVSVQAWRPGSQKSSLIQIRFGGRSVVYSVSDGFLRGRKCRGSQELRPKVGDGMKG